MNFEIKEIKKIRKKIGLTQKDLAKKAGISQSLIAKIESNKIDPSYSSVMKILNSLNEISNKKSKKAKDIMKKNIITISLSSNLKDAVKLMKKHKISQIPVMKNRAIVGLISEATVLNAFIEHGEKLTINDVMDEPPPIIGEESDIQIVSKILKFYPIIIIAKKGEPVGLISKTDLIEQIF